MARARHGGVEGDWRDRQRTMAQPCPLTRHHAALLPPWAQGTVVKSSPFSVVLVSGPIRHVVVFVMVVRGRLVVRRLGISDGRNAPGGVPVRTCSTSRELEPNEAWRPNPVWPTHSRLRTGAQTSATSRSATRSKGSMLRWARHSGITPCTAATSKVASPVAASSEWPCSTNASCSRASQRR